MPKLRKTVQARDSALGESPAVAGLRLKGRIWLEKNGETFLSWGRVVLLERIRDLGSIAAAARSMDMAYSHAWLLVTAMNRLAGEDLVARSSGGRHGGRSLVTPAGEAAIALFWSLVEDFRDWLRGRNLQTCENHRRSQFSYPGPKTPSFAEGEKN